MLPPIEFRRISCVETTKEVWDTLETTHKSTKDEKNSKLQMLTTKFYAKLNDTINSKFNLRENVDEPKIERKVLRSLPQSFRPKVTIIGESRDVDTKKIKELVGLLQTYELTLPSPKKSMSTALGGNIKDSIQSLVVMIGQSIHVLILLGHWLVQLLPNFFYGYPNMIIN